MKKLLCLLLAVGLLFALTSCSTGKQEQSDSAGSENTAQSDTASQSDAEETAPSGSAEDPGSAEEPADWTREGYFQDEDGNMLTILWWDDADEPGWYTACMLGEDWVEDAWSGILEQEGNALRGELASSGGKDPLSVTVTEEGEDGLQFTVDGVGTYHFTASAMETASIFVSVNTEGWGNIDYAEGEEPPEIDPEYPYQSAQINLAEPAVYTLIAWPDAGNVFVKWTKDGEEYSTEPMITVLLDETADFIAVFEEDPDWQNPVMNFIGEYQCDRAHALVECFGKEDAWITIDWADSASALVRWDIVGRLDTDTLTIRYEGCPKKYLTFDENGEIEREEELYSDGTGTVVFGEDGSFTWHEDQADREEDLVFRWSFVPED